MAKRRLVGQHHGIPQRDEVEVHLPCLPTAVAAAPERGLYLVQRRQKAPRIAGPGKGHRRVHEWGAGPLGIGGGPPKAASAQIGADAKRQHFNGFGDVFRRGLQTDGQVRTECNKRLFLILRGFVYLHLCVNPLLSRQLRSRSPGLTP
jgi:hypothetical protein